MKLMAFLIVQIYDQSLNKVSLLVTRMKPSLKKESCRELDTLRMIFNNLGETYLVEHADEQLVVRTTLERKCAIPSPTKPAPQNG